VPAEFPGGLTERPGEQVSRSIEQAGEPTDGPAERAEAPGRLAAVLGKPIAHSLSPMLHRAAYVALGLAGWRYSAIECAEDELARVLAEHPDAAGFSCTMPLKRAVLRVAASASPVATAIGAANTLLPTSAGWHAENTDWIGIRRSLLERGLRPRRVIVLGAGGTAQAALAALAPAAIAAEAAGAGQPPDQPPDLPPMPGEPASAELPPITVLVREPARATELLTTAERLGVSVRLGRLGDRPAGPEPADLLICALPPGAVDPLIPSLPLGPACAVLDSVYAGWPTPLAVAASDAGAPVISGASLLLHQAAGQVELMTGRAAPVEAMRAAMREAVPGCDC
jgi:shikimate dehydrogenase